jgi:hypothetical protein
MIDRLDDIETRLRQLPSPHLPDRLKQRVLGVARLAPAVTWRDRAWYSLGWRLAAAALLMAVLAADHWTIRGPTVGATFPSPAGVAELEGVTQAGVEIGMPEAAMRGLAARMEFVPLSARETRDQAEAAVH